MLFEVEVAEVHNQSRPSLDSYRVIAKSLKEAITIAETQAEGDYKATTGEEGVAIEAIEARLVSVTDPIS